MDPKLESQLIKHFEKGKIYKYKKREIILRPENKAHSIIFVKSGYVRLYKTTDDGEEITINLFKPLFPLTLLCAANTETCGYYFEAITEVELWKSSPQDFENYLNANPKIKSAVLHYTFEIIETLLENIEHSVSGDARTKVEAILRSIAKRHGKEESGYLEIDFDTSHRIIASVAGITRETASKQIKQLEKKGLIQQKPGKIILKKSMVL